MQKCSDCNGELLEDLDLFAQGVYQVGISQGKTLNQRNRATIKAAVCPNCATVTFYLPKDELEKLVD